MIVEIFIEMPVHRLVWYINIFSYLNTPIPQPLLFFHAPRNIKNPGPQGLQGLLGLVCILKCTSNRRRGLDTTYLANYRFLIVLLTLSYPASQIGNQLFLDYSRVWATRETNGSPARLMGGEMTKWNLECASRLPVAITSAVSLAIWSDAYCRCPRTQRLPLSRGPVMGMEVLAHGLGCTTAERGG